MLKNNMQNFMQEHVGHSDNNNCKIYVCWLYTSERLIFSDNQIKQQNQNVLARYVYAYKEFVIVTEAPQCNRMTATGQNTDNKKNNIQIYKKAMYKIAKTQYSIQTIMCVQVWHVQICKEYISMCGE